MAAALSFDDFKALRAKGLSPEQIASLEKSPDTGKPVAPHTPDWRANLLTLITPTTTVLGGMAGAPAGPLGVAAGAAVGAASGRSLENSGRKLMGLPANQSLTSGIARMTGHQLPAAANEFIDPLEQGLIGATQEGTAAKLFGVPGKVAGALEQGMSGVAGRQAAKAEAGAARKAGEVIAAREAGPETQAALAAAEARRTASAANLSNEIALAAGKPGAPQYSFGKIVDRMMHDYPRAYTDRNELTDALYKQLQEASQEVHGVTERRSRFDLPDLQHVKQTLDTFTANMRKAAASGGGKPTGLAKNAGDTIRRMIEEAVPKAREINAETKKAITAARDLSKFSLKQPGGEVGGIMAGQKQRTAATLARQALEEAAFQPHLGMHGISVSTPHVARLAGGTAKFLGKPAVSGTGRYGGDVLHALLGLMTPQSDTTGGAP